MKKIEVKAERNYEIYVDCDWNTQLLAMVEGRSRVAVIHTERLKPTVSFECDAELFYFAVPDGEGAKNLETVSKLWDWLGAAGFTRTDLIVGIGGGAITDVAGFIASTWLRGIDWVAVPTSVAGMVDASIGGKTGINSDYGKNLIGAFHSPLAVLIDLSWLSTLSDRDFSAGMAEVAKCGFIMDREILNLLSGQSVKSLRSDRDTVVALIEAAASVKACVVTSDFRESFAREVLNYGHTLGHAIEKHSRYELRHGEAISIGLVFAAELSNINGELSQEIVDLHREILVGLGLPVTYSRSSWSELLPMLSLDKKTRGTNLRFVAISQIAKTYRLESPTDAELLRAYERISA